MSDKPLEDRIEQAQREGEAAGKSGQPAANPYPVGTAEMMAWKTAFDAAAPTFDIVGYAREMGRKHAQAGPGFTNPYPIATPERRAWQEAYDSTPKGVPQMSGPKGRSEADFAASVQAAPTRLHPGDLPAKIADGGWDTLVLDDPSVKKPRVTTNAYPVGGVQVAFMPTAPEGEGDPYSKLLADARQQGRLARENDRPRGANPYDTPELRLVGPAEAWALGWTERDNDIERNKPKMWTGPHVEPAVGELISGPSLAEMAAMRAFGPVLMYHTHIGGQSASVGDALHAAVKDAVLVGRWMAEELAKK